MQNKKTKLVGRYADGYIMPLPKKNIAAYRKIARKAGKIWSEYGALEYRECVSDDLKVVAGMGMAFDRRLKLKPGEVLVFSWVVFKSKAHRNSVNKKVMQDKRLCSMDPKKLPFDCKRMSYGGFKIIVSE